MFGDHEMVVIAQICVVVGVFCWRSGCNSIVIVLMVVTMLVLMVMMMKTVAEM